MRHIKKLTPEEYKETKELLSKLDKRDRIKIPAFMAIYNRATGRAERGSSCASCMKKRIALLKILCDQHEAANPVKVEAPVVEAPVADTPKKKRGRPAKKKD